MTAEYDGHVMRTAQTVRDAVDDGGGQSLRLGECLLTLMPASLGISPGLKD